jgi:hypothetical protein
VAIWDATNKWVCGNAASQWSNNAKGIDYTVAGKNVGIGTAIPDAPLHVNGGLSKASAVTTDVARFSSNDASNQLQLVLQTVGDGTPANRKTAIQSVEQGTAFRDLLLNPGGGNVGIGTAAAKSKLDVEGGVSVGLNYSGTTAAPVNGLIVEGNVGIGKSAPDANAKLDVYKNGGLNNYASSFEAYNATGVNEGVYSIAHGGNATTLNYGGYFLGADGQTAVGIFASASNAINNYAAIFLNGNVGIGTNTPTDKLEVSGNIKASGDINGGSDINLASARELYFADGGQIRSNDDNHRILFRRSENKMELREFGDLVFSPGAIVGAETAKVVMKSSGRVGIGIATPNYLLDISGGDVNIGGFRLSPPSVALGSGGTLTYDNSGQLIIQSSSGSTAMTVATATTQVYGNMAVYSNYATVGGSATLYMGNTINKIKATNAGGGITVYAGESGSEAATQAANFKAATTTIYGDIVVANNTWASCTWSGYKYNTTTPYECPNGQYVAGIDLTGNPVTGVSVKCCTL